MTPIARFRLPILWVAAIVAAEILGRRSPSDAWDALGVFVFGALVALTIPRVADCELDVTVRLRRRLRSIGRRFVAWWPELGIDLRGDPPIPRGFPNAMLIVVLVSGGLVAGVLAAREIFPASARQFLLGLSPSAYFLTLGSFWAGMLVMFGLSAFSTWRDLSDHTGGGSSPRDGRVGGAVAIAWLGLIASLVFLIPIQLAWLACALTASIGFGAAWAIDRYEKLRIIWRTSRGGPEQMFFAGSGVRWDSFVMACLIPVLTIPGTGIGRAGTAIDSMPITLTLSAAAAWAATLAFLSYVLHGPVRAYRLSRHDPARREPIPLLVEQTEGVSAAAAELLDRHGFQCVGSDEDGGPAVRVEVAENAPARGAQRLDREADFLVLAPRLRLSPGSLTSLSTLSELRRLDNALLRDQLLTAIRGLLGEASKRRFSNGSGFWLAPHLWYVRGLTRDSDDPDYHTIGSPWHEVVPRRSRQHAHRVFEATEIDLVFAEDGVPIASIESVFERLFDAYDVLGPSRVEDATFVGLQRVRVVIHDFTLGEPFRRPGYREPAYDEIGRARILHIMLDRGDGDEETDPLPVFPEQEPSLVGL